MKIMEEKLLGDYILVKEIGQGALGTVHLAEHRYMKTQYILKVLPQQLATDRGFIQRFEEDVGQLASLDHPNIVKIHNISYFEGKYFLVMDCIVDEFGETTNLLQYILAKDKRLEEEEIYRLLMQLVEALTYAHQKLGKGAAHRGIKLNNVLVGRGKNGVNLYLTDFGLSRIIGPGAVLNETCKSVAEALTVTSPSYPSYDALKLAPLYTSFLQAFLFLAPEQKRGDAIHPISFKTDIYAFGILAYYLLMGEFPEGYFDLPSKKSPSFQLNWDSLIKDCLHPNPEKRTSDLKKALLSIKQAPLGDLQEEKWEEDDVKKLRPIIQAMRIERPMVDPDPSAAFHVDTTVKHYTPERKEEKNIQPLLTEMIVIPGGQFFRGSNDGNRDELPRHRITLNSFAIDIHPVSNEQFVRFLEFMGGEKDSNHLDIIRLRDSRIKRAGGKLSIESGYAKHPVVGVTWYGACAYAKWVGKRLPSEAEWEIAACGGREGALYPIGSDEIEKNQANFFSSDTIAVMSYNPNGYGLYDMAGNVYEWCQDWYGYNYYEVSVQEPENPKGPLQGVYRVLRGGCWKSLKEDLRCSRRHRNNPGTVNGTYGFRCAADVG